MKKIILALLFGAGLLLLFCCVTQAWCPSKYHVIPNPNGHPWDDFQSSASAANTGFILIVNTKLAPFTIIMPVKVNQPKADAVSSNSSSTLQKRGK
jgi:hypothetical protein